MLRFAFSANTLVLISQGVWQAFDGNIVGECILITMGLINFIWAAEFNRLLGVIRKEYFGA